MNKDYVEWLSSQSLPMFDIRYLPSGRPETWLPEEKRFMGDCYEVTQDKPRKVVVFETDLAGLFKLIHDEFEWASSAVGEIAVRRAIQGLTVNRWWDSAGSMTQEIRIVLREGFKQLSRYQKPFHPLARNVE